jgi:hypothetical protein
MLIIAGRRARLAPRCLDLAITAHGLDPSRINNYERWESMEHLDAWRDVATAPETGITIRAGHVMMQM